MQSDRTVEVSLNLKTFSALAVKKAFIVLRKKMVDGITSWQSDGRIYNKTGVDVARFGRGNPPTKIPPGAPVVEVPSWDDNFNSLDRPSSPSFPCRSR